MMSAKVPFNGIALYRSILRLHRAKLEPEMRALGDSVRASITASTTEAAPHRP